MTNARYGGKILITESGAPLQLGKPVNIKKEEKEIEDDDSEEEADENMDEDDEDEFVCPICQGNESETDGYAKLTECEHLFCEPCITEWSKNANTCPICRSRFEYICTCPSLKGDFDRKIKIEFKPLKDDVVNLDQYVCRICGTGDNEESLLLCDGCDTGYHTYCVTPMLTAIPDGDWFCIQCTGELEEGEALDIVPATGSIAFRATTSTRRLAMEDVVRRSRRTSDKRRSRSARRRSSSIAQAVQLISSITGRARTAKGAKLARIAAQTVGIHTLRNLRAKKSKRKKSGASHHSRQWSPPRQSTPERLEAWNNRDKKGTAQLGGFSKSALDKHKAHKSDSLLFAKHFFEEPGPSTSASPPNQKPSSIAGNSSSVDLLGSITKDIINFTSKTPTVSKNGGIVYKTRDDIFEERYGNETVDKPIEVDSKSTKVRIKSPRISGGMLPRSLSISQKTHEKKRRASSNENKHTLYSPEILLSDIPMPKSPTENKQQSPEPFSSIPPPKLSALVSTDKAEKKPMSPKIRSWSPEISRNFLFSIESLSNIPLPKGSKDKSTDSTASSEKVDETQPKGPKADVKIRDKPVPPKNSPERSKTKETKSKPPKMTSRRSTSPTNRRHRLSSSKVRSSSSPKRSLERQKSPRKNKNTQKSKRSPQQRESKADWEDMNGNNKGETRRDKTSSKGKEKTKAKKAKPRSRSRSRESPVCLRKQKADKIRRKKLEQEWESINTRRRSKSPKISKKKTKRQKSDTKKEEVDEFGRDAGLRQLQRPEKTNSSPKRELDLLKDELISFDIPRLLKTSRKRSLSRNTALEKPTKLDLPDSDVDDMIIDEAAPDTVPTDEVYSPGDESPLAENWKDKNVEASQNIPLPTTSTPKVSKPDLSNIPLPRKIEMPQIAKLAAEVKEDPDTADSDNMIIDSDDSTKREEKAMDKPPPLLSSNTLKDLVSKISEVNELKKKREPKSPEQGTPEFLNKIRDESPPSPSPLQSTPEYLITPPHIQEERRRKRLRKRPSNHTKPVEPPREPRKHSVQALKRPDPPRERSKRKLSKSEERRPSRRSSDSIPKRRLSTQENTHVSPPSPAIPLLGGVSPPPPPPPPPRRNGPTTIIQDHQKPVSLNNSLISDSHQRDSTPPAPPPLVYINNNHKIGKFTKQPNSNVAMLNEARRKRSRMDPPSSVDSPDGVFPSFDDSYELEQFNDAWNREAQSPTTYALDEADADPQAQPCDPRALPDQRDPRKPKESSLKDIMASIGRDLFQNFGSDDMDIEDDDVPPPPPQQTKTSTTPPTLPPAPSPKYGAASPDQVGSNKVPQKSKKLDVQHQIANIVKLALKVPYKKKKITKEEYKTIMKQVVSKVYESKHVKRGDPLRPDKITEMVAVYIKQTKSQKHKKAKVAAAEAAEATAAAV